MTREEILDILLDRLEEGTWVLAALKTAPKPLLKEQLRDKVNELYSEKTGADETQQLISSRYILDTYTSRLEGAGLVNVEVIGRARLFSLSELAHELLEYRKSKK
ncbi:hypothetical protein [Cytobacillus sp. IB215665]|uniref:hypothetical protein n=1 Tax=Cytobacillus sp. IB215665 TaxID=3097357 RepID=UPI002A0E436F|nr:hypothetical protein [Cytobacillus sp. IB215665]MDX8367931.1 hypothetical protein [Cytobacillus sp. IB215665]